MLTLKKEYIEWVGEANLDDIKIKYEEYDHFFTVKIFIETLEIMKIYIDNYEQELEKSNFSEEEMQNIKTNLASDCFIFAKEYQEMEQEIEKELNGYRYKKINKKQKKDYDWIAEILKGENHE